MQSTALVVKSHMYPEVCWCNSMQFLCLLLNLHTFPLTNPQAMFVASTCPAGSQYCDNPDHKLSPILPFGGYVARNGLTQSDDRPVTQWIWGHLLLQLTSILSLGSSIRSSLAPHVCWEMLEIWTPNSSLLTTGYFNPSTSTASPVRC